jgi:hypothetical protein
MGRGSRAIQWKGNNEATLARQFAAYGLLKLAPVVVTMGFVAVERRHLMVRGSLRSPSLVVISHRQRSRPDR